MSLVSNSELKTFYIYKTRGTTDIWTKFQRFTPNYGQMGYIRTFSVRIYFNALPRGPGQVRLSWLDQVRLGQVGLGLVSSVSQLGAPRPQNRYSPSKKLFVRIGPRGWVLGKSSLFVANLYIYIYIYVCVFVCVYVTTIKVTVTYILFLTTICSVTFRRE